MRKLLFLSILAIKLANAQSPQVLNNVGQIVWAGSDPGVGPCIWTVSSGNVISSPCLAGGSGSPYTFSPPLSQSVFNISIPAASAIQNGYLPATDYSHFNLAYTTIQAFTYSSNSSTELVVTSGGTPANGCATWTSGVLGSTAVSCGTGGSAGTLLAVNLPGTGTASADNTVPLLIGGVWTPFVSVPIVAQGPFGIWVDGSGNPYIKGAYRVVAGTTVTLTSADNGNTVVLTNAATVLVTSAAPGSLKTGNPIRILQTGAGSVNLASSGGALWGGAAGATTVTGFLTTGGTLGLPRWGDIDNDGTYLYALSAGSGGGGGGMGATIGSGVYTSLPGSCAVGDAFFFISGFYEASRCTTLNTWSIFFRGSIITPPVNIAGVTLDTSTATGTYTTPNGYGEITWTSDTSAQANDSVDIYWPAVATPYMKFLFVKSPVFFDNGNNRLIRVGFRDAAAKTLLLRCGVGSTTATGYWCAVTRFNANHTINSDVVTPNTIFQLKEDPMIVGLGDDGTNVTIALCGSSPTTCTTIYQEARAAWLSSPANYVVGYTNTGPPGIGVPNVLDFIGIQ